MLDQVIQKNCKLMRSFHSTLIVFALLAATTQLLAQQRVTFVTSATGNANLSTWTEAGDNLTGLAAADSICVAQATSGGLANPENFVAWMSDDTDDAYCRVHGLTGKRNANCGETELPVAAGPWIRSDGLPARASIDNAVDIYMPNLTDESGNPIAIDQLAWSAATTTGAAYGDNCENWTDENAGLAVRLPLQMNTWNANGAVDCNSTDLHLLCVETGQGDALEFPDTLGNIAFHTNADGTGNFSTWNEADPDTIGIEAADSICNNEAMSEGLPWPGRYKAWLSDGSTDARDRFESDGPWNRPDGLEVAETKADLIDGVLDTAIVQAENGNYRAFAGVWTGTNADGTRSTDHCNSWASEATTGLIGQSQHSNGDWTERTTQSCDMASNRLYCLSDVDLNIVFEDGFETEEN